jgi:type II secretory ATPase GspE/PulE/Tfp pilus assembly ATPase PilB-like protein
VDVLELGVPFSDPLADGLTNQLAAQRALEGGMTAARVFDLVQALRAEFPETPIVFYTVFSTLHTNDAPSAVTRLVNIGIEPYLVAATLRGVLAQRLVRKICPHCKEAYEPDPVIRSAVELAGGPVEALYRGQGCSRCRGTGFAGRIGVFELLLPDEELLTAIAAGANLQELREVMTKSGFASLRTDGMQKVRGGLTTAEEVFYVTSL